jgi:hypothetical protein
MTMSTFANRKFVMVISAMALLAGTSFVATPAAAQDRLVGPNMYERAGTGTTPNGDRPVGGGMYERAGTGTTPNGDRPVGGGMYEKARTSTAVRTLRIGGVDYKRSAIPNVKLVEFNPKTAAITPHVTTVVAPVVRVPTVPTVHIVVPTFRR